MTEAEWHDCTDLHRMLRYLRNTATDRKLRLFVCACCRLLWGSIAPVRSRRAIETAERFADGLAGLHELQEASQAAWEKVSSGMFRQGRIPAGDRFVHEQALSAAAYSAEQITENLMLAVTAVGCCLDGSGEVRVALLRDVFGNPFRRTPVDPRWLTWNSDLVRNLALTIYEERRFEETGVLADALEDAGCTDTELLGHLRGPGPHVRGCWVLDLLLGKA